MKDNKLSFVLYSQDSLQRDARASECSLQRAREGAPRYPTCCYARYSFKFEPALFHSSEGREVAQLLVLSVTSRKN